ncbi:hypothetical protein HDV00_012559 [Rhizophlyctis rosea]|nr:hypothetical protein HDV00_012559 [Rhizophlyctis rosea]
MPNPDYMTHQSELTWSMRTILIDWLIKTHAHYPLLPETLFPTIVILERFLSLRPVSVTKRHLVGATALLIACKEEFLKAEKYMLGILKFELGYSSPYGFNRRISRGQGLDCKTRVMAKYFLEASFGYEMLEVRS